MPQPKVLVFGASNSSTSINHQLAIWAAHQISGCEILPLELAHINLPIFGVDFEKKIGQPEAAQDFVSSIRESKGIIISLAEHNGSYTVAFKNLVDWASRIEGKLWQNKPLLVLSTSPGRRGGASVMSSFLTHMPHMGAIIVGHFSLPLFNQNFDTSKGIIDQDLHDTFRSALDEFQKALV